MSRETLKSLIDLIPEEDLDTIYNVIIKFVPVDIPTGEEVKAIQDADESIAEYGMVSHDEINWI